MNNDRKLRRAAVLTLAWCARCGRRTVLALLCAALLAYALVVPALSGALCRANAGLCSSVWRNAHLFFARVDAPPTWWRAERANATAARIARACAWRAPPTRSVFLLVRAGLFGVAFSDC